ncbi:MAG: hypothetical protein IPK69_09190 [Phycisphaerales bacterium]|nr:MAG: hypothetical protein IPK69_09190 [Phycisphaerales bacterium]
MKGLDRVDQTPTPEPSSTPEGVTPAEPSHKAKRAPLPWWRRWGRRLLAVVIVLGIGFLVLTRTAVPRWIVCSAIGSTLNADVSAGSVDILSNGRVVIRDASVRARNVAGEAGQIVSIGGIEARPVWGALLRGDLRFRSVEIDDPVIRISQNVASGEVNVSGLTVPESKPSSSMGAAPVVVVRRGVIQLGEHTADGVFTPLRSLDVAGSVEREPGKRGESTIKFTQINPVTGVPEGVEIIGRADRTGLELALKGLTLEQWPAESVPSFVRGVYRDLALKGAIGDTTFRYTPDGKTEARVELLGVGMTLPIETQPGEDEAGNPIPLPPHQIGKKLRMEDVRGALILGNTGVRGSFVGKLEELPYEIELEYEGTSTISPFAVRLVSRNFELTRNPQILRFAPALVQRRMDQFMNPTGIVDAEVIVTRGDPVEGKPGRIDVEGSVEMRDGSAAFERFPYVFDQLHGRWEFDDSEIRIVNIEGVAPSGATIKASGSIAPPTSDAEVLIKIAVRSLPMDDETKRAMGSKSAIIDALFNEDRAASLRSMKRITTAEIRDRALERLRAIDSGAPLTDPGERVRLHADATAPIFSVGGTADVDVRITRSYGETSTWDDRFDITVDDAGLLPNAFPYPLVADSLVITKINDLATVKECRLKSVLGGEALLSARIDLESLAADPDGFVPEIKVQAKDVVIDPMLVAAVPDVEAEVPPKFLLQMLSPRGVIDEASVSIFDRTEKTGKERLGYDMRFQVSDLSMLPTPIVGETLEPRVGGRSFQGSIAVTNDRVIVDVAGEVCPPTLVVEGGDEETGVSPVVAYAELGFKDSKMATLESRVVSERADVSLLVEDLVRPMSTKAAEAIERLREEYQPTGKAGIRVTMEGSAGAGGAGEGAGDGESGAREPGEMVVRTRVAATDLNGEVTLADGRVRIFESRGEAEVHPETELNPTTFEFREFGARVATDDESYAELGASGRVTLDMSSPLNDLTLTIHSARFESPLVRRAALDFGGKAKEWYESLKPTGEFDLEIRVAQNPNAAPSTDPFAAAREKPSEVSGTFWPHSIEVDTGLADGARVKIGTVEGEFEFSPGTGRVRNFAAISEAWSVRGEGSWLSRESGEVATEARFSMESRGLPVDLRSMLPPALTDVMDSLAVSCAGNVRVEDGQVSVTTPGRDDGENDGDGGIAVASSGLVVFEGASADVGVGVTDASAAIRYTFSKKGEEGVPADFDLKILADRARLMGVWAENVRVRVASGPGDRIIVPLISADCHGGRVGGGVTIDAPGPGGARAYSADLRISDVRLASVLENFKTKNEAPVAAAESASPDESRGRVDGNITLGGTLGEPSTKRGRGIVTVGGAQIVNIPVLVAMIRLTNLELPFSERLDYGRGVFYLEGDRINIERATFSSRTVDFFGYGTADLPDLALNLRFRARNRTRIPVISTILEGIRSELFTASVKGTASNPEVSLVTFAGTSRVVSKAMGTRSEQDQRLDRIESEIDEADRGRDSSRRTTPVDRVP